MSDNKKGKAKSQNLPRRSRKQRPSAQSNRAKMPGKSRGQTRSAPIALSTKRTNPTQFSEGSISHSRYGVGQRFVGVQQLTTLVTTASDSALFSNAAPATRFTVNQIMISPDILNGRVAVFANTYARYAFRQIRLEYEPYVAMTQAGGAVLALVNDPATNSTAVPDYTTAQDIVPSVTFALREKASLTYHYNGDDLFFTEYSTDGTAELRQVVQCALFGFPSSSSIGAVSMGQLRIHYVLDMFQPCNTLGVSLSGLTPEEKKMVGAYASSLRAAKVKAAKADETLGEHKDLMEVPMSRQNTVASQSTSSATTASTGSTVSGFRAPTVNEQYVLVSSLKNH